MHGQLLVDQETLESIFARGNRLMQFTPKTKPESNSGGRNAGINDPSVLPNSG